MVSIRRLSANANALIFDLGGGTFEVSLLTIGGRVFSKSRLLPVILILVEKISTSVSSTTWSRNLSAKTRRVMFFSLFFLD